MSSWDVLYHERTKLVVKEHEMALYAKIGAANRTEAVTIALRKHLQKI